MCKPDWFEIYLELLKNSTAVCFSEKILPENLKHTKYEMEFKGCRYQLPGYVSILPVGIFSYGCGILS